MLVKMKIKALLIILGLTLLASCSSTREETLVYNDRAPSSTLGNCSEMVGKILSIKAVAKGQMTEVEAKTKALALIKSRYPHFGQAQALKHFEFLKTSCL